MNTHHDPFDDLLRTALRRRPEALPAADLAARAMELAQARPALAEVKRLRRYRLISRLSSLAAVALIGLIVFLAVHRLADHNDLTLTPGESWTNSSTTTTDASTASSDSSTWNWIVMAGVIGLTGLGAAAVIRQSSPFAGGAGLVMIQ